MDRPSRGSAGEYAPLPEEQQAAPPQTPQRHCDTVFLGAGAAPQPSSSLDNAGRQRRPSSVLRDSLDNAGTTHKIEQLELKLLRRRDLYTFAGDHYQRLYRMLTIKNGSVDLGYHTRCHTRYALGSHTHQHKETPPHSNGAKARARQVR